MKTENETTEKAFDAVKFMREQRDRITKDIMDLSPQEIAEYFEQRRAKGGGVRPSA